ncbi:DUF3667 domain-containing protein [Flavobacterium aestuarii]|uniref:DUF3667 domain-containing protein n=1 Tax=Flavobacterium aestuarii TaxID=3149227 RepID=UPI0032B4D8B5
MTKYCKNCQSELAGKFCSDCGQSAYLKRIDAHYIKHEIEHVLHFDKGIFFTVKELLIRPGKNVREFFTDNRNRLVKPIIFIIITSLIYTLVSHFYHIEEEYVFYQGLENTAIEKILKWIQGHYGYANIMMGIFIAIFIKFFFRKTNYNIYEIIILLCYVMGIGMLIFAFFSLLQGIFHVNFLKAAGLLGIAYTTFAIADFFDKKQIINYLKSFSAYMIGMVSFYTVAIIIGFIIDKIG